MTTVVVKLCWLPDTITTQNNAALLHLHFQLYDYVICVNGEPPHSLTLLAASIPTPSRPCGHGLQASWPSRSWYVPAGHGSHDPLAELYHVARLHDTTPNTDTHTTLVAILRRWHHVTSRTGRTIQCIVWQYRLIGCQFKLLVYSSAFIATFHDKILNFIVTSLWYIKARSVVY